VLLEHRLLLLPAALLLLLLLLLLCLGLKVCVVAAAQAWGRDDLQSCCVYCYCCCFHCC
jgi:hypothetical protein